MDNEQIILELNKLIPNNPEYSARNYALTEAIKDVQIVDDIVKIVKDPKHLEDVFHAIMVVLDKAGKL